jgi:hypothetical protein
MSHHRWTEAGITANFKNTAESRTTREPKKLEDETFKLVKPPRWS